MCVYLSNEYVCVCVGLYVCACRACACLSFYVCICVRLSVHRVYVRVVCLSMYVFFPSAR